jgi:predicted nucleotidyltransferase
MEIIKNTIKVGNSAGVLLPREWLNSEVKIVLQPLNIEKDVLDILIKENLLKNVLGVYLIGSYARGEQTIESDVDILVITKDINKRIKKGKYEITCISKKELEYELKNNAFPVLPWLKEAKVIMNEDLKKSYMDTAISWKNLKWHIETTKKMMQKVSEDIEFAKKINEKVSDASAYSLVLRLRTLYIIDCIRKNRKWTKKEFMSLIKKISGSIIVYERYVHSKNYKTRMCAVPVKEAEKLRDYIIKKTNETKKWLKGKKD